MFSQDKDACDPEEVKKAEAEFIRNDSSRRPGGGRGLQCQTCGRYQHATTITGCCCYYCHQTLK